jgi:hypothetical protein
MVWLVCIGIGNGNGNGMVWYGMHWHWQWKCIPYHTTPYHCNFHCQCQFIPYQLNACNAYHTNEMHAMHTIPFPLSLPMPMHTIPYHTIPYHFQCIRYNGKAMYTIVCIVWYALEMVWFGISWYALALSMV